MLINEDKVNDIILSNQNTKDVVDVGDWEKSENGESKFFVLSINGELYKGEVVRKYTKTKDVLDDDGKVTKKGTASVHYSHEGKGVEVEKVTRICVKEDGKRKIVYR